ncbi:MAG: hypothetical protein ACI9XC_000609 [Gammaproteobacteria bacterium]|jgi:hypothetical protein
MISTVSQWARYGVPDDFWPIAILSILLCISTFIGGFYYFFRLRVLENIPTSKVRSAAQGYLELIGHGQLLEGSEIIAPLTGKVCTWFSYMIQERRRSRRSNHWVTIEQATSDELFLLIDDTGKCFIDPEGASVIPSQTYTWFGTSARPATGKSYRGKISSPGRYRYIEKRMHPGDDLFAIGFYQTVGGANSEINFNADMLILLKEWKSDSEQLLKKFDRNKDGRIDMHEWELVRKAALDEVMQKHSDLTALPPVNILGRTHDNRRPFILSSLPQDTLIKRYKYYSSGLISLFFISGTFVTWILNLRFSVG